MISVIVATNRSRDDLVTFELNIKSSIGVKHEIIYEHNKGERGLSEIYNNAAKKSNYSILCFVHDDVEFLSNNWGWIVDKSFRELKDAAVLGVAGSTYLTQTISSWWQPKILDYEPKRVNIIQKYKHQIKREEHIYFNPYKEAVSEVCTLDGVLLMCRKEIWKASPFEEDLLNGFHGYDMAFCLGIKAGLKNYVIFDLLIRHDSEGLNDSNWYNAIKLVKKKHIKNLPKISDLRIDSNMISEAENFWRLQNECFSIAKVKCVLLDSIPQIILNTLRKLKRVLSSIKH